MSKLHLRDLVPQYVESRNCERAINNPLSANTTRHLDECVKAYQRFLCRPATVDDLTDCKVNEFLRYLIINGRTDYTVKCKRTGLLVLWRFAAREGMIVPPATVQKVRLNPLSIRGYSQKQIAAIIEYISTMRGTVRTTGIPRRMWWEAFVLVDWELGLRCGDMLTIPPGHCERDGWIWVVESKTGKRGWRYLRHSTAARLRELIDWDCERPFVWAGYSKRNLCRAFSEIARESGAGGSLRWIRRGAASEVEAAQPGAGWRFLRHSVPTLFDKHYRDDRIVEQHPIAPPEIEADVFRPAIKANPSMTANLPGVPHSKAPTPQEIVDRQLAAVRRKLFGSTEAEGGVA